jgi:hypothetical protein
VKRLAAALPALPIAWLCSVCVATTGGTPEKNVPTAESRTASEAPASAEPTTENRPPSPTLTEGRSRQERLLFGKSYTWNDAGRLSAAADLVCHCDRSPAAANKLSTE